MKTIFQKNKYMKTNVTYLIVAHEIQWSLSHGHNLSICSEPPTIF